ncbi:ABC transporter ATP-binding protein [Deinococcus roseus]|uniref:ABC transporter ATP-binding protein n=1 Tax=Deinococcus roseus TaxID=392414 RepID=A0ABQ2CZQ0_9DEIO|nr:ABC transporter ATP-binding protein [Deinococcus roseus]GGJ36400.1 ABC transporter ATP-binding protein [Deinococcus roseus]
MQTQPQVAAAARTVPRPLIELKGIGRTFQTPAGAFHALKDIHLTVRQGEFIAVVGPSGSGKSTLINVLTGIDSPSQGEIHVNGEAIHRLNQEQLSVWRGKNVGVVFQFFQLLPTLTVIENVMLPMDFCNTFPLKERREQAENLLSKLGILEQADKLPADLSGGQQQRAAIARALANNPPILVADEPTGNLDSRTSEEVMQLFSLLVKEGRTVIMVTHEREFRQHFTRVLSMQDGRLS